MRMTKHILYPRSVPETRWESGLFVTHSVSLSIRDVQIRISAQPSIKLCKVLCTMFRSPTVS